MTAVSAGVECIASAGCIDSFEALAVYFGPFWVPIIWAGIGALGAALLLEDDAPVAAKVGRVLVSTGIGGAFGPMFAEALNLTSIESRAGAYVFCGFAAPAIVIEGQRRVAQIWARLLGTTNNGGGDA